MGRVWFAFWFIILSCMSVEGLCAKLRPNVLFITVDDLRPELGCYGVSGVQTPNIDRFATTALRFDRAYCQQAVCNPSRTSFMTGMRPDDIGVTGNHAYFRDQRPEVVTLPQHFKEHGYQTEAIGKVYHGVFPEGSSNTRWDTMGDPQSWSRPAMRFGPRYYYTEQGIAEARKAHLSAYPGDAPAEWTRKLVFGLATEAPAVPDSTLYDGKVADAAIMRLTEMAELGQPFFLAVGFIKPHSPYIAPKKYFDLYEQVELVPDNRMPDGAPSFAGHGSTELRRYTDQRKRGPIPEEQQRRIRHAYYACVSFIDAQIGKVLKVLDDSGLRDNTIVVLVGDHGYHLGELGLWGKTTNFELDTRVPLIVRAPGVTKPGSTCSELVELVDLFPTLAKLAELPLPEQLATSGFISTLMNPNQRVRDYALSQYPRGERMGYSIRSATHRLTQWVDRDTRNLLATELYDYTLDGIEQKNIADLKPGVVAEMSHALRDEFGVRLVATDANPQDNAEKTGTMEGDMTSFEDVRAGEFAQLDTGVGTWVPGAGKTIIDNKHAKTGRQCLQLTGGENTSVTLRVGSLVDTSGQLSFWAERWTSRSPFAFRIEKKNDQGWSVIYNGDRKVRVGRAFLSKVQVPLNDPGITHLKFSVQSPPGTGILIDDLKIGLAERQVITSAEVVPVVLPALVNAKTSGLVKVKIKTKGSRNPIRLTGVDFSVSDSGKKMLSAGVYGTGESPRFRADTPFGEAVTVQTQAAVEQTEKTGTTAKRAELGNFEIRGSRELVEGDNYFWIGCTLLQDSDVSGAVGARVGRLQFSDGASRDLNSTFQMQRLGVALRSGGDDGVHTYRIPGLATTTKGTLIGVYDVRRRSGGDLPGDIDVGMSRSTDGGNTWEEMKIIMDMGDDPQWRYDGIGDPAVLVDKHTGTIWVAGTWSHGNRSWLGSGQGLESKETGQLMLVKSTDDGVTWSDPINITKQVKDPDWCFVLQGPGKGITMRDGTLVFAAQYQDPPDLKRLPHSTIIYSKDHGETWQIGSGAFDDTTEAQVVEVEPGVLMLNCRYNRQGVRVVMLTRDMGATWEKHVTSQRSLIEPGACMASLIDVAAETGQDDLDWLLFSNPDSNSGRNHISIKASGDRGLTWPKQYRLLLDEEPSAGYSCMSMIDKETIGILYEGSQAHMTFQRIKLRDVTGATNDVKKKSESEQEKGGSSGSTRGAGHLGTVQQGGDSVSGKQLTLAAVFSNHMVLQSDAELPVWGKAIARSVVEVSLGDEKKTVVASSDGRWSVTFSPRKASFDPTVLSIRSAGIETQVTDILIGEVWLCAGQSNMQWPVAQSLRGAVEVETNVSNRIRLLNLVGAARGSSEKYSVEHLNHLEPGRFTSGKWEHASTDAINRFSAVAWFFAVELQRKLGVPIGIICPALGGTPTESWVPHDVLESQDSLRELVAGNWLDNASLSGFCRQRAEENLLPSMQAGEFIPSDGLGPNHPFKPGFMWEAVMQPLVPFAIKGVAWYQGESNAETVERALNQADLLPALIGSWRAAWGLEELPFLMVQLPAMNRAVWPLFREIQRRVQLAVPNVAMAVSIDLGHPSNVHPRQKQPVARRLAGLALGEFYALKGEALYGGPRLEDVEIRGAAVQLTFSNVGRGVKSKDGLPLRHFEICGSDKQFFPAFAEIEGPSRIRVECEHVPEPKAVRYAWFPYPDPQVNFCNGIDVPASPFTTVEDDELGVTADSSPLGVPEASVRPNVLLIVSEDNGQELGCYGDRYARTPHLDRLAAEGVLFKNAYVTQSVCSSSRSSLFTGLYPHQNGQLGLATHQYAMYRKWPTTYSILKSAGYRTGLIGKTHVNPASVVEDYVDFRRILSSNFAKKKLAEYAEEAKVFINASEEPFFLTVNFPDAHWPLQTSVDGRPSVITKKTDVKPMSYVAFDNVRLRGHVAGYYNCIARLDECVGELLKELADSGKAENTLVIYIGDHGAQFARGKVFITEGGLKIPMIVRWPKHARSGLVSEQLVSTIDLLPTIAAAADAKVPPLAAGRRLQTVLAGEVAPLRRYLFAERNCDSADLYFPQRSVRDERYKLIKTLLTDRADPGAEKCLNNGASNFRGSPTYAELDGADQKTKQIYATWLNPPGIQLYDLREDPDELHDLAQDARHNGVKERLSNALEDWQERTDDRLRHPRLLKRLTDENDHCKRTGRRGPVTGWKYSNYLGPQAVVEPVTHPVR